MPAARYRATLAVDAIQYDGWDLNGPEVVEFLGVTYGGRNTNPDQILFEGPHGTTAIEPGIWLCRYDDGTLDHIGPAQFSAEFALA